MRWKVRDCYVLLVRCRERAQMGIRTLSDASAAVRWFLEGLGVLVSERRVAAQLRTRIVTRVTPKEVPNE